MSDTFLTLRRALRALVRRPVETAASVVILSLGIGVTVAAFALVDGLLLTPLPYPRADRLVLVEEVTPSGWEIPVSAERYRLWQGAEPVEALGALVVESFEVAGGGAPERVAGARASASLFDLLGARALSGRLLAAADEPPEAVPVAVLAESFWRRRFGGEPDVIGREIALTGVPHTVVGILPDAFRPPEAVLDDKPRVWTALPPSGAPGRHELRVLARLPEGVSPAAAADALGAIAPGGDEQLEARVVELARETVGDVRPKLWLFFGGVLLVLLAACANVAGIQLAAAVRRREELAIRAALGAGRGALARLVLAESALLGAGAALGGLAVAAAGVRLLPALLADQLPRLAEVGLDVRVLGFAVATTGLAVLAAGLVPGLRAGASDLAPRMGRHPRPTARLRGALVVSEVALAMVLVVAAGLVGRSLQALGAVETGFAAEDRLAMEVRLDPARHPDEAERRAFFDRLEERIGALPGVRSVTVASSIPFGGASGIVGFEPPGGGNEGPRFLALTSAGPNYFHTLGIPLLAGRDFDERDRPGAPPVGILSESAARSLWPGEEPVGRVLDVGFDEPLRIVGVVGDVRQGRLDRDPTQSLYLPRLQRPEPRMSVVARTAVPPESLADAFRESVWELDPAQPVSWVSPVDELVAGALDEPRTNALLFSLIALIAALLSAVGLYGLIGESVNRRTHEIGVRMALGAGRGRVLRLMLRGALALVVAGVAAGALGAAAAARLLESLLYGVEPVDATTYLAVAALLVAVTLAAAYLPARRAARTDPVVALQAE